jgi:hypothetical protein
MGLALEPETSLEPDVRATLCLVPEGTDESLLASSTGLGGVLGSGKSGMMERISGIKQSIGWSESYTLKPQPLVCLIADAMPQFEQFLNYSTLPSEK